MILNVSARIFLANHLWKPRDGPGRDIYPGSAPLSAPRVLRLFWQAVRKAQITTGKANNELIWFIILFVGER
jgi:hypothetical protein